MNYNRRRYSTTLTYLYRRSFLRKVRRLLKEHSLYTPLTILITTRAIATKAPWSVLAASYNRHVLVRTHRYTLVCAYRYALVRIPQHMLVHAPRNLVGERRRAGSAIATIAARPIKSITVVATLLYTTTIYFPKIPRGISSFVQTSLLE